MLIRAALLGVAIALLVSAASAPSSFAQADDASADEGAASVLAFTMNRIDGTPQPLSDYKGKVLLIVNVASGCGLTPQYEALEALYREKQEDGFVVLAFPANNFGNQEPGSNKDIAEFCSTRFSVTFPMFSKVSVKGEDQCELYRMLTALPAPLGGEPKWNFTKFLVDREGRVVERIEPRTPPNDPAVRARIDALLAEAP